MSKITVVTKLHRGVMQSFGAGVPVVHYEFSAGPRNLRVAARTLAEHAAEMERSWGNVGCGSSWLEIDGKQVDNWESGYAAESVENAREILEKYKTPSRRYIYFSVALGGHEIKFNGHKLYIGRDSVEISKEDYEELKTLATYGNAFGAREVFRRNNYGLC